MEDNKIKIIFIGTPEFGAIVLEQLIREGLPPVLVITETDKPVGRKKIITPPPVKITAQKYNIPIEQPEKIENCKLKIENYKPELIMVAAYGQILPKEILNIPKYGCLNVHPSLLPKYRGPSPIQYAILNGEEKTGVTIMLMDEGVDTGPTLSQKEIAIGPNEISQQLAERLALAGAELLIDVIPDWIDGKINLMTQNENEATYSKILSREDGLIDLDKQKPEELYRRIRALNPWPGTYAIYKKRRMKILKARLEDNKLIIEKVQLDGGTPVNFQDFKRGHPDFKI